jgi:diguanylate cyclase (GGDEF)-like protein/PAS domain S-box-containing protein
MWKVLTCLTVDHDLRLVAVAAVICALGGLVAMRLFMRARASDGATRRQWLLMAGTAAGSAIWATHFLAMLAFAPRLPTGYDPFLTLVSLIVAVTAMTLAFSIAGWSSHAIYPKLGGALIGLGISAMHYTGMAGFRTAGIVQWNPALVLFSVIFSVGFGVLAVRLTQSPESWRGRYGAALALVLAICSLHFTAMGAVTILPDPLIDVPLGAVPNHVMGFFIAAVAALVMAIGVSAYFADKRAHGEAQTRLRRLANAAIEGLIIVKDNRIVDVNTSFEELTGYRRDAILSRDLFDNILTIEGGLPATDTVRTEGLLRGHNGKMIPIELLSKPADVLAGSRVYSVRDLTEKKSAEGRIHYLAHFDSLTGLPNRTSFLDRLEAEIREAADRKARFALLSFDLDRFKEISDMFGHATGDAVLAEISRRLAQSLGAFEFAARFGGDQFFAIVSPADDPERIMEFADRLLAQVRAPFTMEGHELTVGASVGIALYPDDALSAAELMGNADLAMYRAKETPGNKACFFESGMDLRVRERRTLARDLRQAIANDEFELYYQPQSRSPTIRPSAMKRSSAGTIR